jgi:hypothetical protein
VGIDGDEVDREIGQVGVPLEPPSAFRSTVEGHAPYIGPVRSGDPQVDGAIERLGGVIPPAALLLPVVIRERTVALVYAHRGADTVSIAEVAELFPVAAEAAVALSKLILKAKAQGFRKADGRSAAQVERAEVVSKAARPEKVGGGWGKAAASPPAAAAPPSLDFGAEVHMVAEPPPPIDRVLDDVEGGTEPAASRAVEEAMARQDDALPAIARRFPGRLWIDRYATGGRQMRASQHGPLLALTVRIGARMVPMLVEKMGSDDRELRYYATLCLGEVRSPIAVPGLVARLFDQDYGVRGAALEALLGYPAYDVDAALEPVRKALGGDAARARAAAFALGELRDLKAIPDLIDCCDRDHTTAEEAHRALVAVCKQDFGTKAKKWRAWWEKNRHRSRIEWMLEGLGHSEEHVRRSASEELKRLTGEYFGYHYDLPKREREEARQKWLKWWEETGRRRFLREGRDEHGRQTAMLPTQPGKR